MVSFYGVTKDWVREKTMLFSSKTGGGAPSAPESEAEIEQSLNCFHETLT